jgi:hypothetical protein
MRRPLAIDLFCGLGGWTEGLIDEGYRVIGFDNERHAYGEARYPSQLVLQDVTTIHGRQFASADLIVASPPCQAYSYRAMPWKRAKALPPPDNTLFEACFRIQAEAIEAAGHHIPLVVENVCGAQKWVGRARWHYGSFYLWGDVPALMPITRMASKNTGGSWFAVAHDTTSGHSRNPDGRKTLGHVNRRDGHSHTRHLTNQAEHDRSFEPYSAAGVMDYRGRFIDPDSPVALVTEADVLQGVKNGGDWFGSGRNASLQRRQSSKSSARKAASAHIAKIPYELARHIGRAWMPREATA